MPIVTSEHIEIHFDDENPLRIPRIVDRRTGTEVCLAGEMEVYLRMPGRVSDPLFLREVTSVSSREGSIRIEMTDHGRQHRATCTIAPHAEGLRFHLEIDAASPVWMAEWAMFGFELDEIIIPALGGQLLTRDMPSDRSLAYKYPFWWNAQFAIGTTAGGHGVFLRTMEEHPRLKVLRVRKVEEHPSRFGLGLGFEADAPITESHLEAEWFLDTFSGGWKAPVERHRKWLEETFELHPLPEHPHYPAWAEDIDFILEIWAMRKDRGRPGHTFDQIIERIEEFAGVHEPARTLLYLPGFAEGGIDSNAPSYEPAPQCGGREAFKRLVDRAHELGYRVMIHTNVLALTYTHEQFEEYVRYHVVDPFEREQGWAVDIDGDWLTEPHFAYINPGHEAWGELMKDILGELISTFGLDAVFLDQTLLAFNDGRGPNFMLGMRRHIERLQEAYPEVLFAGEGLHEQVLPALPVAQIHGLDSIEDVHGMDGREPWRRAHPVSVALFGKYTRYVAHLLTRHPDTSTFDRQEAAYAQLGIVPALVLYRRSQEVDGPKVRKMIERARRLRRASESESLSA